MNSDIIVPEDFAKWQQSNPTPEQQIDYFNKHFKIRMLSVMWNKFYCVSLQHRGFHCSGCLSDQEYLGTLNFDNKCCCKAIEGEQ